MVDGSIAAGHVERLARVDQSGTTLRQEILESEPCPSIN
jgi:hypothetical protein